MGRADVRLQLASVGTSCSSHCRDHQIRRMLGWNLVPGTLATLEQDSKGRWIFSDGEYQQVFHYDRKGDHAYVPALRGLTNVEEALVEIWKIS